MLFRSLESVPKRGKAMSCNTFLKAHFGVIAATDFFAVEVLTLRGLVRYMVWFVIDLESHRVQIAGMIRYPHDAWIQQVARNLTDSVVRRALPSRAQPPGRRQPVAHRSRDAGQRERRSCCPGRAA